MAVAVTPEAEAALRRATIAGPVLTLPAQLDRGVQTAGAFA